MKNPKFTPLAILILAIVFVTGCTAEPVEVVEDQSEEPVVVEEEEPFIIQYGDLIIGETCQEECLDTWTALEYNSDFDLQICQIDCQLDLEEELEAENL